MILTDIKDPKGAESTFSGKETRPNEVQIQKYTTQKLRKFIIEPQNEKVLYTSHVNATFRIFLACAAILFSITSENVNGYMDYEMNYFHK